jgi:hypothetical protein
MHQRRRDCGILHEICRGHDESIRIQHEGAFYHVMTRANRREAIFIERPLRGISARHGADGNPQSLPVFERYAD